MDAPLTPSVRSPDTLNSTYNKVTFNQKLAIIKENLHTKYTPFTYNDITLYENPSIMKQNLHIFFVIGRVGCKPCNHYGCANWKTLQLEHSIDHNFPHDNRHQHVQNSNLAFNHLVTASGDQLPSIVSQACLQALVMAEQPIIRGSVLSSVETFDGTKSESHG